MFTKQSSIKSIFSNNIQFGKSFDPMKQYECFCHELSSLYGFPLNECGHIQCNSDDIEKSSILYELFNRNCNDICEPSLESFPIQFCKSYTDFFNQIHHVFQKSVYHKRWNKFDPRSVSEHLDILCDASLSNHHNRDYLPYIFHKVHFYHLKNRNSSTPQLKDYIYIKKQLFDKLVLSELDKGKGISHFYCDHMGITY